MRAPCWPDLASLARVPPLLQAGAAALDLHHCIQLVSLHSPYAWPARHRTLLAKEQARIRQQYEERLRDLENERQSMQEDKAQVSRPAQADATGLARDAGEAGVTAQRCINKARCVEPCGIVSCGTGRMRMSPVRQCSHRAVRVAERTSLRSLRARPPPQVERYKALLLKQRDIMIALTQRLNERDEQILALQAELEAYDGHQK